jgi:urea transport system substrate-binding protein
MLMSVNVHEQSETLLPESVSTAETLPPPSNDDACHTLSRAPAPSTDSAEPRRIVPEPEFIGHYRILRVLGQGGMGKVYEAHDTKLERTVALKVMLPAALAQPGARERFLREARTMAAVRNDHIVTVFEVDEAGDTPYLAMELLRGQSLASWLGREQRARVRDVVRMGKEIAGGLAAAHAKGLIHRDIKPGNLWIELASDQDVADSDAPRLKILDFGLARPISHDSSMTQSGAIVGTPSYMSPEQARGETVDGRSDLFSLGIVLYQLCTGRLPFRGANLMAILSSLATEIPVPILSDNPHIPEPLVQLVMALLEKDPQLRPQSAEQVAVVLRTIEARLPAAERGMLQRSSLGEASIAPTMGPNDLSETIPSRLPAPVAATPSEAPSSRRRRSLIAASVAFVVLGVLGVAALVLRSSTSGAPIRIGVLYSRTGPMATSEKPTLDGVALAVQEINERGGVLGRPVEIVAEDGQSSEVDFPSKALKLIEEDDVACLFGCWTSSSRKAVIPVLEKHDQLLFFPTAYEGLEASPHVVYGGPLPNQQIIPALQWMHGFMKTEKWFLVGVDAIYCRAVHAVIRDEAKNARCQIVGEEFLLNDNTGIGNLTDRIQEADPDLIVSTVKGDTNVTLLFRALGRSGIGKKAAILSFTVSEADLATLTPHELKGHYAANTYAHTIDSGANRQFLKRAEKHGAAPNLISDQMQSSYVLVHLWARAAEAAKSVDRQAVRNALHGLEFDAPQGRVAFDAKTQHLVQTNRLARITADGCFDDIYVSLHPIRPEPFPASRSRPEWERFVHAFYKEWGRRWTKGG